MAGHLVLSRKIGEGIVITITPEAARDMAKADVNTDIRVYPVEIRVDKVRLGVMAPLDVTIHRDEVYELVFGHEPMKPKPKEAS